MRYLFGLWWIKRHQNIIIFSVKRNDGLRTLLFASNWNLDARKFSHDCIFDFYTVTGSLLFTVQAKKIRTRFKAAKLSRLVSLLE